MSLLQQDPQQFNETLASLMDAVAASHQFLHEGHYAQAGRCLRLGRLLLGQAIGETPTTPVYETKSEADISLSLDEIMLAADALSKSFAAAAMASTDLDSLVRWIMTTGLAGLQGLLAAMNLVAGYMML